MISGPTILKGIVHGKTIELEHATGWPDGEAVTLSIERTGDGTLVAHPASMPTAESWIERLVFDATVESDTRIVKGTRLGAESLVTELEHGRGEAELLQAHPELTPEDVEAVRQYARLPVGLRRSFGAWADDAAELDQYVEWTRQQRKTPRREVDE